ncbi:MAG: PaaI family thioesterase [bacterium]|nr:PaaI family thioesterase [bacterium]
MGTTQRLNFEDIDSARSFFSSDRFATELVGASIDELGENASVCSFTIGRQHQNAMERLMGGAVLALADFAFAVSTNSDHCHTVTVNINVDFLEACKGERVIASTRPLKIGGTMVFYEIDIEDNLGSLIAKASVVGKRMD